MSLATFLHEVQHLFLFLALKPTLECDFCQFDNFLNNHKSLITLLVKIPFKLVCKLRALIRIIIAPINWHSAEKFCVTVKYSIIIHVVTKKSMYSPAVLSRMLLCKNQIDVVFQYLKGFLSDLDYYSSQTT